MNALLIGLPIAAPMLAGALLLVIAPQWRRTVSVSACALQGLLALVLLIAADQGNPLWLQVGNWPAPFGIVLMLDRLAALMLCLVALLGGCAALWTGTSQVERGPHWHALLQFQLMGLAGAFLTADLFNLFVWFELLLIASYALLLHGASSQQLRAAMRFVSYNLVASALFLVALALIFGVAGTLNMADLARVLPALPPAASQLMQIAAALLLVVFAVKAALLPLGFWLPSSYAAAPGAVAAVFAIMTKVGVYAILRVHTAVFAGTTIAATSQSILLPLGLATLALATLGALAARKLRVQIACLVMASAGLLLATVALGTEQAYAAGLYYLIQTTLTAAALFLVADSITRARVGAGDALNVPAPALGSAGLRLLLTLLLVAAAGLPPLPGFIAKCLILLSSGEHAGAGWVWACVLLSSAGLLLGLTRSYSRLLWNTLEQEPPGSPLPRRECWVPAALVAGLLALSVAAAPVQRYLQAAAAQLVATSHAGAVGATAGRPP